MPRVGNTREQRILAGVAALKLAIHFNVSPFRLLPPVAASLFIPVWQANVLAEPQHSPRPCGSTLLGLKFAVKCHAVTGWRREEMTQLSDWHKVKSKESLANSYCVAWQLAFELKAAALMV